MNEQREGQSGACNIAWELKSVMQQSWNRPVMKFGAQPAVLRKGRQEAFTESKLMRYAS